MNIVYLGWGHHIHLRRWAEYFAKRGERVTVLSLTPPGSKLPKVRMIPLACAQRREALLKAEIRLWLRLLRADIFHVHWAGFAPLAAGIRHCPIGITAWGSDIYKYPSYPEQVQQSIRNALKFADFITCDSYDLKSRIAEISGRQDHVHVVQWGVDTELFRPGLDTTAWRERIGIHGTTRVVYSPRSVNEIYNIDKVLEAFALLAHVRPDTVLIQKYYNADAARLQELQELAARLGIVDRVKWVGEVAYEDLPALYNLADIMVTVPHSDGTPMALLEGMACGVPLVVSSVPSVLEWIEAGRNGLVVPAGDSDGLFQAMKRLLNENSLAREMVVHNLRIVEQRASQNVSMQKAHSIYRGTCSP